MQQECVSDGALSQCVDLELAERSAVEVAAAYRALCGALLLRTAFAARSKTPPRKVELDQRRTALSWTGGKQGVITFEEACAALDMAPEQAREAIGRYAQTGGVAAISRGRPRSRITISRRQHVPRPAALARREVPSAHGVDASPPDAAGDCVQSAWA